jgi:CheY-like chemotaxis protein
MAGGIAHDFNNLLTGILGNASLLKENAKPENRQIANEIVLAAERAADLTQQMLAFAGKGRFVIETLDLKALVHENLALLRASLSRSVTVELDCEPCFVDADRVQLQQIVMNLLINASEAIGGDPGKVTIRTAEAARTDSHFSPQIQAVIPPGNYVLLEVRDSGSGMAPETLKRIFDPFFTTKFTGRGLGLAAVLGIVKGHRGDIEVESEHGAGTAFRIFLPKSERTVAAPAPPPRAHQVRASGKTVLIVDDEEIVRKTASQALQWQGFQIMVAVNGAEALDILRTDAAIALVILDLTMPVMTGEQAIPLIKAMRPTIPIVLSSGFGEAELSRRFASSGIAAFLQKPYTAAVIASKVMQTLQEA